MILQDHTLERFWLERRIQFLKTLNEMMMQEATVDEIEFMAKQFSKVENLKDLLDRLKEIYGKDALQ